mmetsp:Transcript_52325/g.147310  ORF Transcript_52325/g.147310 Transcript_52325/m.147310 type:complete len:237 (-) Transcript_52325:3751-4461(-)
MLQCSQQGQHRSLPVAPASCPQVPSSRSASSDEGVWYHTSSETLVRTMESPWKTGSGYLPSVRGAVRDRHPPPWSQRGARGIPPQGSWPRGEGAPPGSLGRAAHARGGLQASPCARGRHPGMRGPAGLTESPPDEAAAQSVPGELLSSALTDLLAAGSAPAQAENGRVAARRIWLRRPGPPLDAACPCHPGFPARAPAPAPSSVRPRAGSSESETSITRRRQQPAKTFSGELPGDL